MNKIFEFLIVRRENAINLILKKGWPFLEIHLYIYYLISGIFDLNLKTTNYEPNFLGFYITFFGHIIFHS